MKLRAREEVDAAEAEVAAETAKEMKARISKGKEKSRATPFGSKTLLTAVASTLDTEAKDIEGKRKGRAGSSGTNTILDDASSIMTTIVNDSSVKRKNRVSSFGMDAMLGGSSKRRTLSLGMGSMFHGLGKAKAESTTPNPTEIKIFSDEKEVLPSDEKEVVPQAVPASPATPSKLKKKNKKISNITERAWKSKSQIPLSWPTFRVSPTIFPRTTAR
jgi:hypothetical protein